MTTHDDSYADASFDLDEIIDEDITDEAADDNTPARRINVVDSDGDDDDSIHPRARRSSPPEPSPRSSPEEEAGAPEMTTPPSTGRTRLSGGMASLPPLSPRRLSPMSPVATRGSGSLLKPLLAPKSPLPPSPRSPFSSHKPTIYVPPSRDLPRKTPAKLWEIESRWDNVEAGAVDAGDDDVVEEVHDVSDVQSPESSVDSPKQWIDTLRTPTKAERLVYRYSSVNTTVNPVLRRQMELSRRRRDAVTEWTPPKEKRTKARRKPALPRFDTKKDIVDPSKPVSSPARVRTACVDVNAALPVFSNAVSRALASCAVDEGDQQRYLNERGDKTKTNPRATVAMVEDVPALSAVRGPGTPYANVPAHKRYSWYKHYGFGGKGAKTSWGYNPKRGDIGARYESAKSQPAKCTACPASEK